MRPFKRILLVLSLVAAVLLPGEPAQAQLETLALGGVLGKLMDDVQQAIESARQAGNALEIEAGRQMLVVIDQAQAVYADELNKTVGQLDAAARGNINHLSTEVGKLRAHLVTDLSDMMSQAQTIVSLLPFRVHEPKLGRSSPSFAAPTTKTSEVAFRFSGSFEFAGRPQFAPSLRIGASVLSASAVTTQSLEFLVPQDLLLAKADPKRVTFVKSTLVVPWESSSLLGAGTSRQEDSYQLLLGVLPVAPGDLKIVQFFQTHDPVSRHYRGPNHHLSSQREGGNDDHKDVRVSDNVDPGCQIDRASVKQIGSGHGDQGFGLVSIDASTVVSWATTIHHRVGSSGVNDYWIEFDERCPSTQDREERTIVNDSTKIDLRWGDSRSYSLRPQAHYRVVFDSFDGKHNEYTGPLNDPASLLVIGSDSTQVTIGTIDPVRVIWP